MTLLPRFTVLLLLLASSGRVASEPSSIADRYGAGDDWPYYDGSPGGSHYSSLEEINASNVAKLQMAWEYDTRDELLTTTEADDPLNSTMESNPLIVGGHLFFVSPKGRLICLDGESGKEIWTFDPPPKLLTGMPHWVRGVSYWTNGNARRIFFGFRRYLFAIDADTGRPVAGFGSGGHVEASDDQALSTTPGAVYRDLIIMGGNRSLVRAYDVHTGTVRWTFHAVPRPGEPGYLTWPKGAWKTRIRGVNAWAGMSLDETHGLVFIPLGEAYDTTLGVDRMGDDLFSDCLVALDANTGRLVWHFQTARHDLWDRDLPAAPTLVSVLRGGERVDAVAQVTKSGYVFVLDRMTGKSLFPLTEQPALPSDIPGEVVAATQPVPQLPLPFAQQHVTTEVLTRRTPQAAAAAQAQLKTLRNNGPWDPPSVQGTLVFPGLDGGAEWGGAAFDPKSGVLYVNSNEVPWILKLKRHTGSGTTGGALYRDNCAPCHGVDRAGGGEFPSLIGVGTRLSAQELSQRIHSGGARMPAFPALNEQQVRTLVTYLRTGVHTAPARLPSDPMPNPSEADRYEFDGMPKFLDPEGYPAITPPWGTLNAIDLNSGRYVWKIPFGEYPELVAQGQKNTGSENYGGPIVTAGGLLFIGATSFDRKFHAYDAHTGKLLWETLLPAAGVATPATYRAKGRQFVVIAAGGGRPQKSKPGSKLIAFALANQQAAQ